MPSSSSTPPWRGRSTCDGPSAGPTTCYRSARPISTVLSNLPFSQLELPKSEQSRPSLGYLFGLFVPVITPFALFPVGPAGFTKARTYRTSLFGFFAVENRSQGINWFLGTLVEASYRSSRCCPLPTFVTLFGGWPWALGADCLQVWYWLWLALPVHRPLTLKWQRLGTPSLLPLPPHFKPKPTRRSQLAVTTIQ